MRNRVGTKGDRVADAVYPRFGWSNHAGGDPDGMMGGQGKVGGLLFGVEYSAEMIKKEERGVYSKPYSTAMRHASLTFLLTEACCLRLCEEEKSSSQAGQECTLSVDRGALRGV